mmetsp:Transcript_30242/g.78191  ORF Transcript_30242/g.78191 Transcript_30242/m.78191 type:complete len:137 (-) Transcript_30242:562-972(-)
MNQNGESKSLSLLSSIVNDNTLAKVKDDLFIGAMRAANNKDELTSLHITDVLNCAGKKGLRWRNEAAAGITRNWSIELEDKAGSSLHEHLQYVIEVYESVRNQGGKLLVHWCVLQYDVGKKKKKTLDGKVQFRAGV